MNSLLVLFAASLACVSATLPNLVDLASANNGSKAVELLQAAGLAGVLSDQGNVVSFKNNYRNVYYVILGYITLFIIIRN